MTHRRNVPFQNLGDTSFISCYTGCPILQHQKLEEAKKRKSMFSF